MGTVIFIVGLLLFVGLVIVHEMGHFWAARRNGVDVEEFGIFFPPRLWKKRMSKGWDFTINLLPLGGFVKLKGEYDADKTPGSFGAASDRAKVKIMLAGVAVNFVTALVLFTILALTGMPKIIDNQFTVASDTKVTHTTVMIGYVEDGSPAAKAGLQEQDEIISFTEQDGAVVDVGSKPLATLTKDLAGQEVTVTYTRNGDQRETQAVLNSEQDVEQARDEGKNVGYLGVEPVTLTVQRSTWSAPVVAVGLSVQLTKLTLQGLWHALQGLGGIIAGAITGNTTARQHAQTEASSQVSGPLGIYFVLKGGSALGVTFMLFIIAIISLTLAIMNILPIPALDGGRVFVMGIARLLKKPLTRQVEEAVYGTGFVVLLGLIALITFVDVKRFF